MRKFHLFGFALPRLIYQRHATFSFIFYLRTSTFIRIRVNVEFLFSWWESHLVVNSWRNIGVIPETQNANSDDTICPELQNCFYFQFPEYYYICTIVAIITRPSEVGYIDNWLWHVPTSYLTTEEVRLIILLPDLLCRITVSFMVLLIPAYNNVRLGH